MYVQFWKNFPRVRVTEYYFFFTTQLGDDVHAGGTGDGVPQAEITGERVRAVARRHEYPHTARPHRRESAGKIGAHARQALDAPAPKSGCKALWAVD